MRISDYLARLKNGAFAALFVAASFALLAVHLAQRPAAYKPAIAINALSIRDPFAGELLSEPAFRKLEVAARQGDIEAKLEVAKRYAAGRGVRRNEARAFVSFQSIANQYAETDPKDRFAQQVSEAFRELALFYRRGVPDANISPDPDYAFSLLHYSASYFGDSASQVELAKLILSGEAASRNPRIAAQWLYNASRKGSAPAQALLGKLLWHGEGVNRIAGDGLALLSVALRNAAADDRAWVKDLYVSARAEATPGDILDANAFIARESATFGWKLSTDILIAGATESETVASSGTDGTVEAPALAVAASPAFETAVRNPVAYAAAKDNVVLGLLKPDSAVQPQ